MSSDKPTRRTFCGRAAALAVVGGTLGTIFEGCGGSPTSPTNATSLPVVAGIRTGSGVTVAIDSSSPLASVGNAALVQASGTELLVARTGESTFVAPRRGRVTGKRQRTGV